MTMTLAVDMNKKFCDIEEHPDTNNCVIPVRSDCDEAATKDLGQRRGLSDLDLESVVKLYGSLQPSVSTEKALAKSIPATSSPAPTTKTLRSTSDKPNAAISWLANVMSWFSG